LSVFAGQLADIREVEDRIWLVSFLHYDLGYFDHEEGRVSGTDLTKRGGEGDRHLSFSKSIPAVL